MENTATAIMPGPANGNESGEGRHCRLMHLQVSCGVRLMTACVTTGAHRDPLSQYIVPKTAPATNAKPQPEI